MCQQHKTEASMIKHSILFISLDIHKSFTEVAHIEDSPRSKAICLGRILKSYTQEQSGMVGLCLLQAQTCRYLLKSLCIF